MSEFDVSDKISKKLDFNAVVFLQLNRIMRSISINDTNALTGIEALEALLSPFEDEDYLKEIKTLSDPNKIKEMTLEFAKNRGIPVNKLTDSDQDIISFILTKRKLKAIMGLAQRNDLLPEKSTIDEIR